MPKVTFKLGNIWVQLTAAPEDMAVVMDGDTVKKDETEEKTDDVTEPPKPDEPKPQPREPKTKVHMELMNALEDGYFDRPKRLSEIERDFILYVTAEILTALEIMIEDKLIKLQQDRFKRDVYLKT